jgi:hypothetical protein
MPPRDETQTQTNTTSTPSLVSRLQKIHGLSKKKNSASHSPPRPPEFFTEPSPAREKSTHPPPQIAIPSPPRRSMTAPEGMPLTSIGRRPHHHPTSPREAAAPYTRSRISRTSPPGAQSELRPDGYIVDPTMSQVYMDMMDMHTNGGWSGQRERSNSRRGSAASSPIIPLLPFSADPTTVSGGGETDAASGYSSMAMASSSPHSSTLSSRTPLPVYSSSSPEPTPSDVYVSSPASMTSPSSTTASTTVPFRSSPPFPTASHLRHHQPQLQPQLQAQPQPQQTYVPTPSALVAAPLLASSIFTSPTMIEAANQDPNQPFIFPENEPIPPVTHYIPAAASAMTPASATDPGWPSSLYHQQQITHSSTGAATTSMPMTAGTGYINSTEYYLESAIPRQGQIPPSFGVNAMGSLPLANGMVQQQPLPAIPSSLAAAAATPTRGTTAAVPQQQRRTAADDIPRLYTGHLRSSRG